MDTTTTLTGAYDALQRATRDLAAAEVRITTERLRLSFARDRRRNAVVAYNDALKRTVEAPYKRGRSA